MGRVSDHVERFQDFMVKNVKTGDCFRADHLIEGESMLHLGRDRVGALSAGRLAMLKDFKTSW